LSTPSGSYYTLNLIDYITWTTDNDNCPVYQVIPQYETTDGTSGTYTDMGTTSTTSYPYFWLPTASPWTIYYDLNPLQILYLSTSMPKGAYTININVYAKQNSNVTAITWDFPIDIYYCGYESLTASSTYTITVTGWDGTTTQYVTNTVLCGLITHSLSSRGTAKYCPVDTFELYDDSAGTTAYSYTSYLNLATNT
jgi:hypothetical protein